MVCKEKISPLQAKVKRLYEHNGWNTDPTLLLLAMQEELGEVAARWLAEHPGCEKSLEDTDPVPEEIGDLLQLVLAFCNTQNIDFEKCVEATVEKRWKKKKKDPS